MIMSNSKAVWRALSLAGVVAGAMAVGVTTASAGECPADKVVASGQGQQAGATMPKDVTDTVLGAIDLAKEPVAIKDRRSACAGSRFSRAARCPGTATRTGRPSSTSCGAR